VPPAAPFENRQTMRVQLWHHREDFLQVIDSVLVKPTYGMALGSCICNPLHIRGNQVCYRREAHAGFLGSYRPPSTSLAMVCNCMFDVPS